jgi:hypothetical protein
MGIWRQGRRGANVNSQKACTQFFVVSSREGNILIRAHMQTPTLLSGTMGKGQKE